MKLSTGKVLWEIVENALQLGVTVLATVGLTEAVKKNGENKIKKATGAHRDELLTFIWSLPHHEARQRLEARHKRAQKADETGDPGAEDRFVNLLFDFYTRAKDTEEGAEWAFVRLGCLNEARFNEALDFMEQRKFRTLMRKLRKGAADLLGPTAVKVKKGAVAVKNQLFDKNSTSAVKVRNFRIAHADSIWLKEPPKGDRPWYTKYWR